MVHSGEKDRFDVRNVISKVYDEAGVMSQGKKQ